MKLKTSTLLQLTIFTGLFGTLSAQHNNEFYNNGSLVHVQAGAEVHVLGDVHNYQSTGRLENNGLIVCQGDMYSDNLFQQRGTGTTRLRNNNVNTTQTQFIQGSYAVRGGQSQIGVNDGSFYNLELSNSQGIVWLNGTGNVADVRNSVDYNGTGAAVVNRIITANPAALPANGSNYSAVFGIMNPTAGHTSAVDNTVVTNGNNSGVDNGYVQGKLRRAISAAGGIYNFVLGLEPAGAAAKRGMQYIHLDFQANNYDVVEGFFQSAEANNLGAPTECSGWVVNYYGGADHGKWKFEDIGKALGTPGAGTYTVKMWPQDHTFPANNVWVISKDNQLLGTPNQCGTTWVGLERSGYNGFSEFAANSATVFLNTKLIDLYATPIENRFIEVGWTTEDEDNVSHFEIERSTNNMNFEYLTTQTAAGNTQGQTSYAIADNNVLPNQDYYYRIKTVDNDGSFEYTHTVVARITRDNAGETVNVYPNPVNFGNATVEITSLRGRKASVRVFDAIGQMVYSQNVQVQTGINQVSIPSAEWPAAVYFIQVSAEDFNSVKELIKIK